MAKDPKKPLDVGEIQDEVENLRELLRDYPELEAFNVQLDNFNKRLRESPDSIETISSDLEALAEVMHVASRNIESASASLKGLDYQSELLITRLTGVRKSTNATFIEAFGKAVKNTKSFGAALGQMAETAQETLTTFNVGIATVRKFAEGTYLLTKGVDTATALLQKQQERAQNITV